MLSKLFNAPARIQTIRCNPAGSLIEGFADHLVHRGYSKISARRHIRSAEHFVQWAARQRRVFQELGDGDLQSFAVHLDRCRCGRFFCGNPMEVIAGARLFLRHVQGVEQPPIRKRNVLVAEPELQT